MLVELVVGIEPLLYAQMLEQNRCRARILGQYEINLPQNLDGPQRYVPQIAYRRRHYIQLGHVNCICVR